MGSKDVIVCEKNLADEFSNCMRLIDAESWESLREKLRETPALRSYSSGDASLLSYARTISDDTLKHVVRCGVDPDIPYSDGATLLMDYTSLGKVSMVRFLISNGSDVNKTTPKGETAFTFACAKDRLACAKFLHARGAKLNVVLESTGTTPEDIASQFASVEFQEWLSGVSPKRS